MPPRRTSAKSPWHGRGREKDRPRHLRSLGITAQGLDTIHRLNKRTDFAQLERVIRDHEVSEIVMGLPLRMSGAEGIQAEKMQAFAGEIAAASSCRCTSGTNA